MLQRIPQRRSRRWAYAEGVFEAGRPVRIRIPATDSAGGRVLARLLSVAAMLRRQCGAKGCRAECPLRCCALLTLDAIRHRADGSWCTPSTSPVHVGGPRTSRMEFQKVVRSQYRLDSYPAD